VIEERLDRQLRIKGWDQEALGSSQVGIVGDDDLLASLFVLSASALGINDLIVLAPRLDSDLVAIASKMNPKFNLAFLKGYFTHPALSDIFSGSRVLVDLSAYGLANKLAVDTAFATGKPLVRGFRYRNFRQYGLKIFTYVRGKEHEELGSIISPNNLPQKRSDDAVLDTIAAGIALEEVKNLLLGWKVSPDLITYGAVRGTPNGSHPRALVVGAGALGNFVAMGLAYSGITGMTIMDPDRVEIANLNRQVFFYDAIGRGKAETLASRINERFGAGAKFAPGGFDRNTDISGFDAVFDCVDNFETRIIMSEKGRTGRKVVISGGTSATAGQVIVFDPAEDGPTPAELLGLYEIVDSRKAEHVERSRASCRYVPDPSVIMTNQIVAGLMVDAYRVFLNGNSPANIFYNAESDRKILT
jgi:molybdopterin/thiamine biosynthesis adenylyltransferase